jgi:hypothetical protein
MFGPSEGYTFITVDANIGDLGENNAVRGKRNESKTKGMTDRFVLV